MPERSSISTKRRHCENLVNNRFIEYYSQSFGRYIQCKVAISTYELLGKHPTTGCVVSSSFVQMAIWFQKTANLIWMEIYDIVKQDCTEEFNDKPHDTMELLLKARRKHKWIFLLHILIRISSGSLKS